MIRRVRVMTASIGSLFVVVFGCVAWYGRVVADDRLFALGMVVMFGVGWLGTLPSIPLIWRGETRRLRFDEVRHLWPHSVELWEGWMRCTFIYAVFGGPMFVLTGLMIGIGEADWPVPREQIGGWFQVLTAAALIAFVAVNALALSVVLFNRPHWAVPPSLRDQYGWIWHLDAQ